MKSRYIEQNTMKNIFFLGYYLFLYILTVPVEYNSVRGWSACLLHIKLLFKYIVDKKPMVPSFFYHSFILYFIYHGNGNYFVNKTLMEKKINRVVKKKL